MEVKIYLKETSQEILHTDVKNCYTKGLLYCVYSEKNNEIFKYPLTNIFRIIESYEGNTIKTLSLSD